jgi:hypothetical protein
MRISEVNLFEARGMAEKIKTNAPNAHGPRKGQGTGDVFLELLAKNPKSIIDTQGKPLSFSGTNEILKIAKLYQQQHKSPITDNPKAWLTALDDAAMSTTDLNKIQKTADFGTAEKEKFSVKPSQIFDQPIDDKDIEDISVAISKRSIPGKDLAKAIIGSKVLNNKKNPLGSAVIETAKNLSKGSNIIPAGKWWNDNQAVKAMQDYAGEYLGVVGLINNVANFPNASQFLNFMGTSDLKNLSYYFPSKVNVPLADSFGYIENEAEGITMNISSKGGTKGAAPSLTNIKVTPAIRKDPKYKEEVKFIETVNGADQFQQIFDGYNLLSTYDNNTRKAMKQAKAFDHRGFAQKDIDNLKEIYDKRTEIDPKTQRKLLTDNNKSYLQRLEKAKEKAKQPVGFICYHVQRATINAINKFDALPDFEQAVRTILGENFMQIYTIIKGDAKKGGTIDIRVLYPAQIEGKVELASKASQRQIIGKLSFSISPGKGYFN